MGDPGGELACRAVKKCGSTRLIACNYDNQWGDVHDFAQPDREVLRDLADWMADRRRGPVTRSPAPDWPLPTITTDGIGIHDTWRALRDNILPTGFATDHPRYLAFVGGAPTPAAVIADAALSASAIYGGSQLEAGDVVRAERAAMRWLCDVAGYPASAHGVFVSGGSMANLSALVTARHSKQQRTGRRPHLIVASAAAHSSVQAAATIMGCDLVLAGPPDARLHGVDLEAALADLDPADIVGVVANAGATNTGAVDELDAIASICAADGLWMHVDAAYGGGALLAPSHRPFFAGLEHADSITIDPHKWLFTPFDCAAILYKNPDLARAAHTQNAEYLDVVTGADEDNPSDYATHLTRRARGLPLWASLVANGTEAYVDAVECCLALANYAAKQIEASAHLDLVTEPALSVVLFRRVGWEISQYEQWSTTARRSGMALITPTTFCGQPVLRLCFVNPLTTTDDLDLVFESLESDAYLD